MKNDKIVTVRISNKLYEESMQFASSYGLTFSQLIRLLLEKEVRNKSIEFVKFHDFDNMLFD
jgi:antitoxin component of RelBE/YafQ-DinJ toxin-antitoxin module